jgi:hypothetical protein
MIGKCIMTELHSSQCFSNVHLKYRPTLGSSFRLRVGWTLAVSFVMKELKAS